MEGGEGQVGFAGDDMVGELDDGLGFGFEADLRSAEDDLDIGECPADGGDAFEGPLAELAIIFHARRDGEG